MHAVFSNPKYFLKLNDLVLISLFNIIKERKFKVFSIKLDKEKEPYILDFSHIQ